MVSAAAASIAKAALASGLKLFSTSSLRHLAIARISSASPAAAWRAPSSPLLAALDKAYLASPKTSLCDTMCALTSSVACRTSLASLLIAKTSASRIEQYSRAFWNCCGSLGLSLASLARSSASSGSSPYRLL